MKNWIGCLAAFALTLGVGLGLSGTAAADGCYICTSGSSCGQYCRHSGPDTQKAREACKARGCKIGGTASCPTAANVKICRAPVRSDLIPVAWLHPSVR
ncbi:MAG: hypothetical protein IT371_13265 [Deltaproteobacteria bacterium]|nr:hypothetical protein [Deltaproteobacteria bacterium]